MDESDVAQVCRALSNPNRLKIVKMLAEGDRCGCRILEAFDITQPTLSHHMSELCACDLVRVQKEGKWCHYSLNCETLCAFKCFINSLECTYKRENLI